MFLYKTVLIRFLVWVPLLLVLLIYLGCAAVGPNHVPPDTPVSETWQTRLKGGLNAEEMDPQTLAAWWNTLNDPGLSNLIERAVEGNLDLKKARARIREARARRGIAEADFFPTLNATGSASWSRSSEDSGTGKTKDLFAANFDAGWELDIFGGVRRSVEAAEADLAATRENLRDMLVSLLAEVALNYLDVRTYQVAMAATEANLQTQSETYRLTQWRYEAGLSDELAVQQARYNLENTRSMIPPLRTGLEEGMNRIAVLLGEPPGEVHEELQRQEPIPVTPLKVAVGVPADALRRRPDVRRAERELAAQTARIGVATADLYPKFRLRGSIGLETLSMRNLSTSGAWTLSGGPGITWAVFDAGAIRQNIAVQSALQEQQLFAYEAAVLGALEEVENALTAYAEQQERRQSLREAARAARKAAELAQYKYEAGLTDFNNVLEAQRSLLSFQEQLAKSEGTVTSNLVRLYKALGGGWTSIAPEEKEITTLDTGKRNEITE
ncbi:MAG: efflux transporter outer membrane subunit [Deltaproteobacteria bacterium]|nr:efflux transporter outer membrane subunit [Deltaproteobacteria bacterium]